MTAGKAKRVPPLTLVAGMAAPETEPTEAPARHATDWSILMAHAQAGDREAYRRLLEEITPYLRSLSARRHRNPNDVEDAVQDILLTVHRVRHTYDPTRPFGPWLVAIARRRLIDAMRRQGRLRSRETVLDAEHETFSDDQPNIIERELDRQDLQRAVSRLPAAQRRAIQLLKLDEMSLKEAASITGMSVNALKAATHRGLNNLRKLLVSRNREP